MCTFILAWRVFADEPVVVAANRDEHLDRASRPPAVVDDDPRVVAPLDEEAGGTWLGYNEHGVLVSVTNRWTDADLAGERSRGLLVREALARESAAAAAAYVTEQTRSVEYAGFNLVVADADLAALLAWDGELTRREFAPGVHVVVNVGADDTFEVPTFRNVPGEVRAELGAAAERQVTSARRARAELAARSGESADEWVDRAVGVLRDHEYGFCVHREEFGTRSSSVVRLPTGGDPVFEYADGPPCDPAVTFDRVAVPDPS
ncbi:MAG: NRDE family protein [Halobacteriaceae archaeon]